MAQLIVEIHVPLTATMSGDAYPFPWIEEIEEYLAGLEEDGGVELYDDGEEEGAHYIFFITGADEPALLAVAAVVAALPGVPRDAFAMVTDDQAPEFGLGRRFELSPG